MLTTTDQRKPRVESVDVLRGFALCGILVMNIQSFALPHTAYTNPFAWGDLTGPNLFAWVVARLFFDYKFISLFSTLFGASLVLAGTASRPVKRLLWLAIFGLIHAYLIWYGDVLFTYAVIGLTLLALRAPTWRPRTLVIAGLTLLSVPSLALFYMAFAYDSLPPVLLHEVAAYTNPDPALIADEIRIQRANWLAQMPLRAAIAFDMQTWALLLETGWRAAGCMMLGIAAIRSGFFHGHIGNLATTLAALALGIAITAFGIFVTLSGEQPAGGISGVAVLLGQGIHDVGSVLLAYALAWLVVTAALRIAHHVPATQSPATQSPPAFNETSGQGASTAASPPPTLALTLIHAIATLGRFAFTAYIMQSLMGVFVFGGQGFALFARLDRLELLFAAFFFWAFQLVLATRYARHFRVGPLEALWRGLSRGDFSLAPTQPR